MIDLQQERYESLPEFIREPETVPREQARASIVSAFSHERLSKKTTTNISTYADHEFNERDRQGGASQQRSRSTELETLWPGINHDVLHAGAQRGPGFYLTSGFAAGVLIALSGVWLYMWLTHCALLTIPSSTAKKVVVSAGGSATNGLRAVSLPSAMRVSGAEVTTLVPVGSDAELVVPVFSVYEVKSGDTLAAIAMRAYHRVSPRLLDAICRANGMRSADVLNLGQKLLLPEYRPSVNQQLPAAG